MQQYNFPRPVYIKDLKDVPDRVWHHDWLRTIDFNKLPRVQLKVRMCCPKCEEKVLEEIWEVRGVFDVMASRVDKKVVVTAMPELPDGFHFEGRPFEGRDGSLDTDEVLRKARKIDCRAKFVRLDHVDHAPPKPPQVKPPSKDSVSNPSGRSSGGHQVPQHTQAVPMHLVPTGFHPGPPPMFFRDPAQDDNTPFYFFLFIILLLSLLIFRK